MKNYLCKILLLLVLVFISQNFYLSKSSAWSYFDSYQSGISWQKQVAHLDNFAIHLKKNPDNIGYIGFYTKEKESFKEAKTRINRSVKYLTQNISSDLKVEKSRIVIIYGGKFDDSIIILQPIDKKSPPLNLKFPDN